MGININCISSRISASCKIYNKIVYYSLQLALILRDVYWFKSVNIEFIACVNIEFLKLERKIKKSLLRQVLASKKLINLLEIQTYKRLLTNLEYIAEFSEIPQCILSLPLHQLKVYIC